uniref:Uncharacterized protein n=1 Tax=Lepeophtheirus salmonis TaxID=72036 RepID=A0A0K2U0J0_LEPSM
MTLPTVNRYTFFFMA